MAHKRILVLFAVLAVLFSVWYPGFLERMNERYARLLASVMVATGDYTLADTEGWNALYHNAPNETAQTGIKKILIEQTLMEAIQKGRAAEQARAKELEEFLKQSEVR